ncbi:MAG: hypothetical protein IPG91_15550 [Ideonella sp.]|nr:hypothetical protein [Ideonella sp.]
MAVTVEVRADEGTPVLARTTLDAVVGGFEFGDDIYLDSQAKIAAFNASGITRVVGNLSVELDEDPDDGGGGETALNATLPGVVSVGGSLSVQGPLTALSMPALTEVGGSLYIDRITTPVSASFSSLRQLGGELYVSRNTGLGSMNFGQLKTLNGLYVTGNSGLGSANFPQLESVGNDGLFVTDNIGLTSASFPQLASVLQAHGGIFITDNESISSLKIGPALIAATSGGLFITGNAVLSNPGQRELRNRQPGRRVHHGQPCNPRRRGQTRRRLHSRLSSGAPAAAAGHPGGDPITRFRPVCAVRTGSPEGRRSTPQQRDAGARTQPREQALSTRHRPLAHCRSSASAGGGVVGPAECPESA